MQDIYNSLVQLIINDRSDSAIALLKQFEDINRPLNESGWNPLHMAIEWYRPKVVEAIIQAGASLEAICNGATPLCHAIDLEVDSAHNTGSDMVHVITSLLIDAGANLDSEDAMGRTPLALAQACGHFQAVEIIKKKKQREETGT